MPRQGETRLTSGDSDFMKMDNRRDLVVEPEPGVSAVVISQQLIASRVRRYRKQTQTRIAKALVSLILSASSAILSSHAYAQKLIECKFVSITPKEDRSGWTYAAQIEKERLQLLIVRSRDNNSMAVDFLPYTPGTSIRNAIDPGQLGAPARAQFSIAVIQDDGVMTIDQWDWSSDNSPELYHRVTLDCPNAKALVKKK